MGDSGLPPGPRDSGDESREAGGQRGPEFLVVGRVARPHGTKGEVFILPLTDEPDDVFVPERELILGNIEGEVDDESDSVVIEGVRPFKQGYLVKFEEYPDRTAVEPIASRYLLAPAETLAPLEEGEVYTFQLLGLEVVTEEGDMVGRVREVYDLEPAQLLEVKGPNRSVLIPFVERIVREIDLEAGRLVISPPPGLLDL